MSEQKSISIKAVLQDLENGLNRVKIGEKYGINPKEVKYLFEHPKLKGKKAKTVFVPSFIIEDDSEEQSTDALIQTESPISVEQSTLFE